MRVLDRAQSRIPQPWRTIVDWVVTVAVAILVVAAGAAALFARILGAPIGKLARGTRALTMGRYDTRIRLEQRDAESAGTLL